MDNNIRKKNIVLSVVVVLVGILLAGGTYAYLTFTINVTNNVVNVATTCFDIDYLDTNQITGTLFPSVNHTKGVTGTVSLKINSACDLKGVGTIYLRANSGTSTKFITTAVAHCEDPVTLETLPAYASSSTCVAANKIWVTDGTPLKYAIFNNSAGTGEPLDVGYVNSIGSDLTVLKTFMVTSTQVNYYLFVWLDGYLTDNTYTNLPFNGYIKASAIQDNPYVTMYLPSYYQKVQYLSGSSRVITDIIPADNRGVYARIQTNYISLDSVPYNYFGSSDSNMNGKRFYATMKNGNFLFGWNTSEYGGISLNTTDINVLKMNYLNSRKLEFDDQVVASNIPTLASTTFPIHLYGQNRGGNNTNGSKDYKLYEFKVSEGYSVIADLVPCYRKGDKAKGFYDVRSNVFYNQNSLTLGPDVN